MAGRITSGNGWIFCLFHVSILSKQNDREAKDPVAQVGEEEEGKGVEGEVKGWKCFC